jgi:hypothetical protein
MRSGLCPGKLSRCAQWRPPYICFSKSPSLAWALSAQNEDTKSKWDLWMMWSNQVPKGYEKLCTDGSGIPTEYRIYDRIHKRKIWHVGTKEFKPRKKHEKTL